MERTVLDTKVENRFRLLPVQKKALTRLKISTIEDLIFHFPSRYSDIAKIRKIVNIKDEDSVTVYGKIGKIKTRKAYQRRRILPAPQFPLFRHMGRPRPSAQTRGLERPLLRRTRQRRLRIHLNCNKSFQGPGNPSRNGPGRE